MKNVICTIICLFCMVTTLNTNAKIQALYETEVAKSEVKYASETIIEEPILLKPAVIEIIEESYILESKPVKVEPEIVEEFSISEDDIYQIALVAIAEAEGESEEGKRLVIDTVLNRIDHELFPNTVHDVLYQANQYTSMTNGRSDRCTVTEDVIQLVKDELACRTNRDVLFFRTKHYHSFGTPLFQVGNHYFSTC